MDCVFTKNKKTTNKGKQLRTMLMKQREIAGEN